MNATITEEPASTPIGEQAPVRGETERVPGSG